MSVDFSNVQAGDRIKLTRANGDEATFTVERKGGFDPKFLESHSNGYVAKDWDTLEILDKVLPEPPTRYGAMIHDGDELHTYYVLNSSGVWLSDSGSEIPTQRIKEALRDGWKVVFEGLDYDA